MLLMLLMLVVVLLLLVLLLLLLLVLLMMLLLLVLLLLLPLLLMSIGGSRHEVSAQDMRRYVVQDMRRCIVSVPFLDAFTSAYHHCLPSPYYLLLATFSSIPAASIPASSQR
jgi:hypothetical protein